MSRIKRDNDLVLSIFKNVPHFLQPIVLISNKTKLSDFWPTQHPMKMSISKLLCFYSPSVTIHIWSIALGPHFNQLRNCLSVETWCFHLKNYTTSCFLNVLKDWNEIKFCIFLTIILFFVNDKIKVVVKRH